MKHYSNHTIIVTGRNRRIVRLFLKTVKKREKCGVSLTVKEKTGVVVTWGAIGIQSRFFVNTVGTPQAIEKFTEELKQNIQFV